MQKHVPPETFFLSQKSRPTANNDCSPNSMIRTAVLLALALLDSASAQATYYVMYKKFASGDTFCGGSFENVYNSDLNEARIDANDNSVSSGNCYKKSLDQYMSRSCNSTSGIQTISTYSSSGCSGVPSSVSTFDAQYSFCLFFNNPPLIYMGCTSDEKTAISKGYKDVNTMYAWILVCRTFYSAFVYDYLPFISLNSLPVSRLSPHIYELNNVMICSDRDNRRSYRSRLDLHRGMHRMLLLLVRIPSKP
jgi:hypothetical protein